jgi:hypothetical protein
MMESGENRIRCPFGPASYPLTKRASIVFSRESPLDKQTPSDCAGMKHVYILPLRRFSKRINWRGKWNH